MRIRTYEPRRYFDVLTRDGDVDINMYDDNELIDGYKFEGEYFRERMSNVLVVERTETFAVALNPVTKRLELFNLETGSKVNVDDVEEGFAHMAQEAYDLYEPMYDEVIGQVVEDIFNKTAIDKAFITEVLYGG